MRIHYYKFPEGVDDAVRAAHGCPVIMRNGEERYVDVLSDDMRAKMERVDDVLSCSVSAAKKMLKVFGGAAWTEHCERDGNVFEVTEIVLKGNNSRFRYNRHL